MAIRTYIVILVAGLVIAFGTAVALAKSSDADQPQGHGPPSGGTTTPSPTHHQPEPTTPAPTTTQPSQTNTPPMPTQPETTTPAPTTPQPTQTTAGTTPTQPMPTTPAPTTTQPSPPTTNPTPQPIAGPTPTAPQPDPQPTGTQATPSPSPWSNCSVTSAGVTCPLNCAVASGVSSSCPQGTVAPNPRGEVLAAPPTFGGQKKRAKPNVPDEREAAKLTPVAFGGRPAAHELPFTGLELLPLVILGLALVVVGLVLRRGTSSSAERPESGGEAVPPRPVAVDPMQPRPQGIAVQGLVLVACGLLFCRRSRH